MLIIKNDECDVKRVQCGFPQVSVLSSLLFLVYITDLINSLKHLNKMPFADSSKSKLITELEESIISELQPLCN